MLKDEPAAHVEALYIKIFREFLPNDTIWRWWLSDKQQMLEHGHLNPQGLQWDDRTGKKLLAYLHNEGLFTYFEI